MTQRRKKKCRECQQVNHDTARECVLCGHTKFEPMSAPAKPK